MYEESKPQNENPYLEIGRNITVLLAMALALASVLQLDVLGFAEMGAEGYLFAVLVPLIFVGWNWDRLKQPLILAVSWFSLGVVAIGMYYPPAVEAISPGYWWYGALVVGSIINFFGEKKD